MWGLKGASAVTHEDTGSDPTRIWRALLYEFLAFAIVAIAVPQLEHQEMPTRGQSAQGIAVQRRDVVIAR